MSKRRKLCPFRKITIRTVDDTTGRVIERERFQICAEKFCMAYLYTAPIIREGSFNNPENYGCARILNGSK